MQNNKGIMSKAPQYIEEKLYCCEINLEEKIMREDIQQIIENNLEAIIELVKVELPRGEPEPDYVIIRELGIYFSK